VGFGARLQQADAVVTGEGRLDDQTLHGKVMDGVTRWARAQHVPVYAFVGQNQASEAVLQALGIAGVETAGSPTALQRAAFQLTSQLSTTSATESHRSRAALRNKEVQTP
jgi:glycerate 2-kinase